MIRTIASTTAAALLLVLTACGEGGDSTDAAAARTMPTLPVCTDLFKPGQKIDQAKAEGGCLDPDGKIQVVGAFRCDDGRHLWLVDASTGAPAGWGFGDGEFNATENATSDPIYRKANEICKS